MLGLTAAIGCALPDLAGSAQTTSGGGSSSSEDDGGDGVGDASSGPGVATSTDAVEPESSSGDAPTTDGGTGPASGTTTTGTSGGSEEAGTTDGEGDSSGSSSGTTTGPDEPLCDVEAEPDACMECVATRCEADYCECTGLGDCLCVLGCLDSDSLGALLGCVLGECGLQDVSLDTLGNLLSATLSPLDGCEALDSDAPDSCAGVCPATALFPL